MLLVVDVYVVQNFTTCAACVVKQLVSEKLDNSMKTRTSQLDTSIFSIFGVCTGNVRSTPTPYEILRTVNVSEIPPPRLLMTTPSKTWILSRLPSMIRT